MPGYEYSISTLRSFYFVEDIPSASVNDWIVAMHNGKVVGTRQWKGKTVDIPVMGSDGEKYSKGYPEEGDVPEFKLYHTDTGELEDLFGSYEVS